MAAWTDVGLTLKTYKRGEFDRSLTLLTAGHGLVAAFAKGAGKPKSRFFAASQPFALSRLAVFEGRGFLSLTDAEVVRGFFGIAADYDKYHAACSVLETVCGMVMPGVPQAETLRLTARALSSIEKGGEPLLSAAIFKIKYLQSEGLAAQSAGSGGEALNFILGLDGRRAFGFRASPETAAKVIAQAAELTARALEKRLKTDVR